MSWSFGFTCSGDVSEFNAALEAAEATYKIQQEEYGNPVTTEVQDQIDAASGAARGLLRSRAVGTANATYNVTLSGHANPGHVPTPGYANDFTMVNISQIT